MAELNHGIGTIKPGDMVIPSIALDFVIIYAIGSFLSTEIVQ